MLTALLETGRKDAFETIKTKGGMEIPEALVESMGHIEETVQRPLKFAVSYSGFGATTNALYTAFYEPKIQTPMLHFLGSADTVVEEARSLRLVDACVDGRGVDRQRLVYHPGGHFVPSSQRRSVGVLIAFIREICGGDQRASAKAKEEESVDDINVPF